MTPPQGLSKDTSTAQDWRPALFDRALSGLPNCAALKGRNHLRRTKSDAINIKEQLEP